MLLWQFEVAAIADIKVAIPIAEYPTVSQGGDGQGAQVAGDTSEIAVGSEFVSDRALFLTAGGRSAVSAIMVSALVAATSVVVVLQAATAGGSA